MRLIFAGTPRFAEAALARLHDAGHSIELVLTQPDRPAGRGLRLQPSPVRQFALAHGIPVAQPRSLRLDGKFPDDAARARAAIEAVRADAMVVAAYGLILPQWVLDTPRLGCLNIHASLLPRWRGAAPIQRAIELGDAQTGVTIMQMDAGLDTGAMLLAESIGIAPHDSAGSLEDKLAQLGARLIVRALELHERGELDAQPQPAEGVSYAHKIDKSEAAIDWRSDAAVIERRIRAFDPAPGASTRLGDATLKLWRATVEETDERTRGAAEPAPAASPAAGTVVDAGLRGIRVVCGDDHILRITELQRAGARRIAAADFVRGFALRAGAAFELPQA